jgi:Protein of unknown function (DUF1460)
MKIPCMATTGTVLLFGAAIHYQVFAQPKPEQAVPVQSVPVQSVPVQAATSTPESTAMDLPNRGGIAPKPPISPGLSAGDRTALNKAFKLLKQDGRKPFDQQIQSIAEQFLGAPYQGDMLDRTEPETLTLSLQKFDCVLFVESVLAIVRSNGEAAGFVNRLQAQRYRQGQIQGYCSRLHYFSDWIADNQRRGFLQDLTPQLGGLSFKPQLDFMSRHWRSYPRLVANRDHRDCIDQMEQGLQTQARHYIPTDQIAKHYGALQSGDIVAIATSVSGLDVTHTGLVYRDSSGNVGIIHAAPMSGVKISRDLQRFVGQVDQAIGIMVARPLP